jgi:hypothetical protein
LRRRSSSTRPKRLTVAELLEEPGHAHGCAPARMDHPEGAATAATRRDLLLPSVLVAEALIGAGVSAGRVLFFAATLPGWIVVAKL